jgi:PLP dependent protein
LYEHIAKGLAEVRARMADAAGRAGRRPQDVRLIAVSKTHSIDAVRAAADAGQRDFGENKVQEALDKMPASAQMGLHWHLVLAAAGVRDVGESRVQAADQRRADAPAVALRWHLVGHLQSNKAKKVTAFDYVHAIDSTDLLRRVDQAALVAGRTIDTLVQVDLALEPTKHGAPLDTVHGILQVAAECRAAQVVGLMLLPPLADNPEDARPWFARLRQLRDDLAAQGVPPSRLRELSMGMSHDYQVAIEEGATMIRVGTAIFGQRDYP